MIQEIVFIHRTNTRMKKKETENSLIGVTKQIDAIFIYFSHKYYYRTCCEYKDR